MYAMYRPLRPLPQIAYDKMKEKLKNHKILHFFLHNTYCRLVLNYNHVSFNEFMDLM